MYKTYWAIVPLMDRDLRHDADMDLATYNALVHTHLAGPNGIRMKDMAKNASLSTSGLTALVTGSNANDSCNAILTRTIVERPGSP